MIVVWEVGPDSRGCAFILRGICSVFFGRLGPPFDSSLYCANAQALHNRSWKRRGEKIVVRIIFDGYMFFFFFLLDLVYEYALKYIIYL